MSVRVSESTDGAAGSRVMDIIQDTLCEVLDFIRESLVLALSACSEEKEKCLDVAWLKLKRTICRTCGLFQHLQVGTGKRRAAVSQHCFDAVNSSGT